MEMNNTPPLPGDYSRPGGVFPVLENGNTYISRSGFDEKPEPLAIEYVREHGQILKSNGATALVEVCKGLAVSFLSVTLTPDGKIDGFVPRMVNKYVRVKSEGPR